MKEIPFLSAVKTNTIEKYKRFYHLKSYIKSKSKNFPTTIKLMNKTEYRNLNKFRKHREEFDNLTRNIPLLYLKAIKIDMETLKFCAELDMEQFKNARETRPLYPKYASIRYFAGVYSNLNIPNGMVEEDAVELIKRFAMKNRLKCFINYPDFKTIFIEPDGKVYPVFFPPRIYFTAYWLLIRKDGRRIGKSYIK